MFDAIDGVDLLLKDFMKHESCVHDYIRQSKEEMKKEKEDEWPVVRRDSYQKRNMYRT